MKCYKGFWKLPYVHGAVRSQFVYTVWIYT
jgi:hypothetical protein